MSDIVERLRARDAYLSLDEADDEIERLRGELLLITQLQAGDGSTVNGLTKDQLGRAFRQAQDIARAALGIVTHGDSISGSVNPDQPPTVLTNPWNGEPRDIRDVESDPTGILMVEPGKPLRAADQPNVAPSIEWRLTTEKINDLQINSIKRLIPLCKAAHFVNVRVRINGTWEEYQADWIKHMVRIERAADPTPAPQPSAAQCRLEEKPCGDIWLHMTAPSGNKASLNLGHKPLDKLSFIDRVMLECATAPTPAPQPQCACEYYWPGQGHHPDCPTRATNPTKAGQPERCCLDYPRCDCNSPPEPDNAPAVTGLTQQDYDALVRDAMLWRTRSPTGAAPCPLCGRLDPHTHTSGPGAMS